MTSRFLRLLAVTGATLVPIAAAAFFIPTSPTVLEYVNENTGHYVLIRDPQEVAGIDAGAAGPGWRRTGHGFYVQLPGTEWVDGNVCRFYSPSANSHFHTGFADECRALRDNPRGWIYEKTDFTAALPTNGQCPASVDPVYRLFNGRGAPNHRFTASPEVREEMVAAGWTYEGIAFCAQESFNLPALAFIITGGKVAPTSECEDEAINLGPCVALNQLPRLVNSVTQFLAPWWVAPNPAYPVAASAVTGFRGAHDLFTAQPLADPDAVVRQSFLQTGASWSAFGIHVAASDRTVGDLASINPLYQFSTRPDQRVFPWPGGRDRALELQFQLQVKTLRRGDANSHAYGHPTLQFADRTTGEHLYVTLGAYSSVGSIADDYLARDVGTQRVIVSTNFRANPAFGKTLAGTWINCAGDGGCETPATESFRFRIDRAAFDIVLARARTLAPNLSANPGDYYLANYHFNNEVYRDAEIGVFLSTLALEIFER